MNDIELSICTDCLIWHANADSSGIADPEREAEVRAAAGLEGLHIAIDGEDLGFSWSRCDACNTRLGGDRHKAVAWAV